jgi:hypothetical protein
LCKFLITDEPTKEMKQPIIDAFKKSDGFLPEIHKQQLKLHLKIIINLKSSKRQRIGLFKLLKLVICNGLHHQK